MLFSWVSLQVCDQHISIRLCRLRSSLPVISTTECRKPTKTHRVPLIQKPHCPCQQGKDQHSHQHCSRDDAVMQTWKTWYLIHDKKIVIQFSTFSLEVWTYLIKTALYHLVVSLPPQQSHLQKNKYIQIHCNLSRLEQTRSTHYFRLHFNWLVSRWSCKISDTIKIYIKESGCQTSVMAAVKLLTL